MSIEFDEHLKHAGTSNLLPVPTGFSELDEILGGGLHPESLMLLGGPPGVGKTIFAMQATRNIAASGDAMACVNRNVVLLVDYLQKIPVFLAVVEMTSEIHIRIDTEGLKNLAMEYHVPIVAVAASDVEGLKGERVRFQDLWGGSAVQYERDVAVMLNRRDANQVLACVEKNRLGPTGVEFNLNMIGSSFAFRTSQNIDFGDDASRDAAKPIDPSLSGQMPLSVQALLG